VLDVEHDQRGGGDLADPLGRGLMRIRPMKIQVNDMPT
jgi:hypothetical protein